MNASRVLRRVRGAVATPLLVFSACSGGAENDEAAAVQARGAPPVHEGFTLTRFGGRPLPPRHVAARDCTRGIFRGWYALDGEGWRSLDSVMIGCDAAGVAMQPGAIEGRGTYTRTGDTLRLFVRDSTSGVRGFVGRALLRGDSLLVWGSGAETDRLYVRSGGR